MYPLRHLTFAFAWLLPAILLAQGPRMTVRGTQTILDVERAEVTVRINGSVAETVMELRFRNDLERVVEGEFMLPLPAGATVSTYALEVNGNMREAVAVEKERARHAYETIKRQMIDPGIVEREEGNIYRTRIFPIPPGTTKSLRIGYVETLGEDDASYIYQLPLSFPTHLKEFQCEIHGATGAELKLTGDLTLEFARHDAIGLHAATATDVWLDGAIRLSVPVPAEPAMIVEDIDLPPFLLTGRFPEMPETPRPAPDRVRLFWEASEPAADFDQAATMTLLDAWFAKIGDVTVDLFFLRDAAESAGVHQVRGGDWSTIRETLEAVAYEGAVSLHALASGDDADLVIYRGSGRCHFGRGPGEVDRPLIFLKSGDAFSDLALSGKAYGSGGAMVQVDAEPTDAALTKLLVEPFRIIDVAGRQIDELQIGHEPMAPGTMFQITGRLLSAAPGVVELQFGTGNEVRLRREVRHTGIRRSAGMLRRLWAQQKLSELERTGASRGAIIHHCKLHSLVSDETSLIVLERFEDHIRFEIPPPEPDLLKIYHETLAKRIPDHNLQLRQTWRDRLEWHAKEFPGRESVLFPWFHQVSIWKGAVESVFEPDQLDAKAFATVAGWHRRALAIIESRGQQKTRDEYHEWIAELEELHQEATQLSAVPVDPPQAGQPVVVSVRGLVADPGLVRAEAPLTLSEAVRKAGGSDFSKLRSVAIYRNATKQIHNLKHPDHVDVPLVSGDMIVVQGERFDHDGFSDPFAPAEPAVLRRVNPWVKPNDASRTLGPPREPAIQATPGAIRLIDPAEAEMPDLTEFARALAAGEDPAQALRTTRGKLRRPAAFHVEAARLLYENGHHGLAHRVLSTLVARGDGSPPALLAHAFWLIEFGREDVAAELLSRIHADDGGAPLALVSAELQDDSGQAIGKIRPLLTGRQSLPMLEIALAEINRHEPDPHPLHPSLAATTEVDLRITVISQFPGQMPGLTIVEPGNIRLSGTDGVTPQGGRLIQSDGVAEYMIRRAVPGTYRLSVHPATDTTLRIAMHTDWGRDTQKTIRQTRHAAAGRSADVVEIEFEFGVDQR